MVDPHVIKRASEELIRAIDTKSDIKRVIDLIGANKCVGHLVIKGEGKYSRISKRIYVSPKEIIEMLQNKYLECDQEIAEARSNYEKLLKDNLG